MPARALLVIVCKLILSVTSCATAADDDANNPEPKTDPFLTLRLIDQQGNPITGAKTGIWAIVRGFDDEQPGNWNFRFGGESDQLGIVRLCDGVDIFRQRPIIYARDTKNHLVAVHHFADTDLGKTIDVVLHPECHVRLKFKSTQLERLKHPLQKISVLSTFEQSNFLYSFVHDETLHVILPPGKFQLEINGSKVKPFVKEVEVKSGIRELDLGTTDLEATEVVQLEGKPAPELEDVCEWKNGPPLKLADLRGKVVILEFWGWWCGSCVVRGIPRMFKLREEFAGKKLVVIGVHTPCDETDEIDSVERLDAKLAEVKEKIWMGRDIDFPVAICRRKSGKYSATSIETTASKICFEYGINVFPTTVVIDRQGNVAGAFDLELEEDQAKLKRLLDTEGN